MRKFLLSLISLLAASGFCSMMRAQNVVECSPAPLQQDSKDVVITFYADRGNQGLMGLASNVPVYAHTGVIAEGSDQWAYAPAWLTNTPKYQLTYVAPNTYTLKIGTIAEYYGITDPSVTVERLAFVFRTADGGKEGKTALGGDIFVNVLPDGFQMEFTSDAPDVLTAANSTVNFTVNTTRSANITITVDGKQVAQASGTSASTQVKFNPGDESVVKATAVSEGETVSKEITVCYPRASVAQTYPGGSPQQGAVADAQGNVTFCLAAPGKSDVMLLGSWNGYRATNSQVMNYTDIDGIRYFWTTVSGLDPNTEYPYYYLVDNTMGVGDPYARLVLDPYSDKWLSDGNYPGLIPYPAEVKGNVMLAVYKGNRDKYNWKVTNFQGPAQEDLIIYEMLLRDFSGTEGKAYGDGTLNSALEHLDYLKKLGVNAIELMPIQEFNGNNSWGYNTNFYFAPDKAYGSPDDYRNFIDRCHEAGIAVILDVVFNQSDGLHPWYQMYPAGNNPFYNERAPHAYSVLNDWNQDNLLVQRQWEDMLRYWLTAYKVDGFRFDLVKGLGDNASYGGNASEANTNKYNASRVERMKTLTQVMKAVNPNSYSINENLAGAEEENQMAANGQLNWANINEASCQFAMGYQSDSNLNRFYAPSDSRTWGSTVSYAESHDEQRVAYKQRQFGVTAVKNSLPVQMQRLGSLAAQMILAPGVHMIWQFGELGNATSTKNADGSNNTDPKPVLWSYYNNANRRGLYDSYSELIGIRLANTDLFAKTASFAMNCNTTNWGGGRTIYASTADKELICVINPLTASATISGVKFKSTNAGEYKISSQSYGADATFDPASGKVTLPAGCYVVITRGLNAGLDDVIADEAAEGPTRWYTLQGLEVTHPEQGKIYIRMQGNKASKVIF